MATPGDPSEQKHFLDVGDAEIVHGPDVIAEKVSGALRDADRFDMPHVKPPLADALNRAKRASASPPAAEGAPVEQDALSCAKGEVDERAGSAELLQPGDGAP